MEKEKVIIDCDPGIDDALALIYAIKSNKFNILGITTVSGNVPADEGAINACKILSFLGVNDIPVYVGEQSEVYIDARDTHGENGLGNYSVPCNDDYLNMIKGCNAVKFIIDTVDKYPGEVTIVALGPLTNISKAINHKDTFLDNVKEIVSMGGTFRAPGNCTPVSEYNYWCDPYSAKVVYMRLAHAWEDSDWCYFPKIYMVGLDVTRKIVLTHDDVKKIKELNPKVGELVEGITNFYFDFHKKQEDLDGCVINDPVAIFYALTSGWFFIDNKYYVDIINLPDDDHDGSAVRGMVLVDANKIYRCKPNAIVALDVDVACFWDSFISTITK